MTPEQEQLILDVAYGLTSPKITKSEFLQRWPAVDGSQVAFELLTEAVAATDGDLLDYALIVGGTFGCKENCLPLLDEAASADWHSQHENIAQSLSHIGTEQALPSLARLVSARPPYAEELDNAVALARHALHGIEGIGGPQAEALIRVALADEREPVRANAQRMLDRM